MDKEGKESITIATPEENNIGLLEKADETDCSMITLHHGGRLDAVPATLEITAGPHAARSPKSSPTAA